VHEVTLTPAVSALIARKELERNALIEFANAAFTDTIAVACKDAGLPEGAEFTLAPTDEGLVKITYTVPQPETVPTDAEGAE
jgi:hypothetical protein